jgi:hypothetical protein
MQKKLFFEVFFFKKWKLTARGEQFVDSYLLPDRQISTAYDIEDKTLLFEPGHKMLKMPFD